MQVKEGPNCCSPPTVSSDPTPQATNELFGLKSRIYRLPRCMHAVRSTLQSCRLLPSVKAPKAVTYQHGRPPSVTTRRSSTDGPNFATAARYLAACAGPRKWAAGGYSARSPEKGSDGGRHAQGNYAWLETVWWLQRVQQMKNQVGVL